MSFAFPKLAMSIKIAKLRCFFVIPVFLPLSIYIEIYIIHLVVMALLLVAIY
jgi:hypothetical protein